MSAPEMASGSRCLYCGHGSWDCDCAALVGTPGDNRAMRSCAATDSSRAQLTGTATADMRFVRLRAGRSSLEFGSAPPSPVTSRQQGVRIGATYVGLRARSVRKPLRDWMAACGRTSRFEGRTPKPVICCADQLFKSWGDRFVHPWPQERGKSAYCILGGAVFGGVQDSG